MSSAWRLTLAGLLLAGCAATPVVAPVPPAAAPQPGVTVPDREVVWGSLVVEATPPKVEVRPFPTPEPVPAPVVTQRRESGQVTASTAQPQAPAAPIPQRNDPPPPPPSLAAVMSGHLSDFGCGGAAVLVDDARLNGVLAMADWYNGAILVASRITPGRMRGVAAHECAHLVQYRVYGGDIDTLAADMNTIYGGSGWSGLEQNADCVAAYWGAPNGHYTSSCGGARGDAAAQIARGSRP